MADSKKLEPCAYSIKTYSLIPLETGRTLGQGAYATVKEAVKISTGEKLAVKVIAKALMRGREHMILNEYNVESFLPCRIDILKKISQGHNSVITLYDYFETPNNLVFSVDSNSKSISSWNSRQEESFLTDYVILDRSTNWTPPR
jgi:serine/threonine protein kinase